MFRQYVDHLIEVHKRKENIEEIDIGDNDDVRENEFYLILKYYFSESKYFFLQYIFCRTSAI